MWNQHDMAIDLTPKYPILAFVDTVVLENDGLIERVGGLGGRLATTVVDTINQDGTIDADNLSGTIPLANTNIATMGWTQTCAFSSTDLNTVSWGAGTLTTAGGTAYSIAGGNTGNMAARTYIYLDIAVSTTAYQTTTTAGTAVGSGKILVATAINGAVEAEFQVFGGAGGLHVLATDAIVANSITAGMMNVSQLSAISADLGTITAGTVTGATVQTDSGATAGIKMDSTSLRGYDGSGNVSFELVRTTGAVTARNVNIATALTAGENLTAGNAVCLLNDLFQKIRTNGLDVLNLGDVGANTYQAIKILPRSAVTSTQILVYLKKEAAPVDNLTLEIQGDSGGSPDGTAITNGTSNTIGGGAVTTTAFTLQTFNFASAFSLTSGTTYWIVFKRSGAVDAVNYYYIDCYSEEYASFSGKTYDGSSWGAAAVFPYFEMTLATGTPSMTLWKTDASLAILSNFFGICSTTTTAGNEAPITLPGGVNINQTGLTKGSPYFLSEVAGEISTAAGPNGGVIGRALSATSILIKDTLIWTKNGSASRTVVASTGIQRITHALGRIPAVIKITALQIDTVEQGQDIQGVATYNGSNISQSSMCYADGGAGTTPIITTTTNSIIYSNNRASATRGEATLTVINEQDFWLNWVTTVSDSTLYFTWEVISGNI